MRNYQRCRSRDGGHKFQQGNGQKFHQGGDCGSDVETVVEPTVHCRVPSQHHHQRVRHIVPIVYHQAHHHHKHHEYEVKRKFTHEHRHHEHGRFDGDWCDVDGRGQSQGEEYDNTAMGHEFESGCESEMYM